MQAVNIIKNRITRGLALEYKTSINHQAKRNFRRRRGSYKKGVTALPHSINFRVGDELKGKLDALCAELGVERGVIVRDALEVYVGIARQEGLAADNCPTTLRRKTSCPA